MSRWLAPTVVLGLLAPTVVLGLLAATPAEAGWRDYLGKTLVVETQTGGQTETDVITARGGASSTDDISKNDCTFTYHLYVSLKGRLFVHAPISKCAGADRYVADKAYGEVFDLNKTEGQTEPSSSGPALPYSLSTDGDELQIYQPQTDYRFAGDGYISTFSKATGGYTSRIRFAPDCSFGMEGEASYRFEFDSTTSDYYSLQDTHSTYSLRTLSCKVVDGFQVN